MTRFLEDGDRVKVMIQFRGREQQHIDLGASTRMLASLQLHMYAYLPTHTNPPPKQNLRARAAGEGGRGVAGDCDTGGGYPAGGRPAHRHVQAQEEQLAKWWRRRRRRGCEPGPAWPSGGAAGLGRDECMRQ